MTDFNFVGSKPYTPPIGDAVNFAYSTDRIVVAYTELQLDPILSVEQHQYAIAEATITISGFASGIKPTALRFKQRWPNAHSPIDLKFIGEVIPEPPIANGKLGMELALVVSDTDVINTRTTLVYDAIKLGVIKTLSWSAYPDVEIQTSIPSLTGDLHIVEYIIPFSNGIVVGETFSITWGTAGSVDIISVVNWSTGSPIDTANNVTWYATPIIEHFTKVDWVSDHIVGASISFNFTSKDFRGSETSIAWGDRPPGWNCSTKYRPPTVGTITMRFKKPMGYTGVIRRG